jgi:hypothetical protein
LRGFAVYMKPEEGAKMSEQLDAGFGLRANLIQRFNMWLMKITTAACSSTSARAHNLGRVMNDNCRPKWASPPTTPAIGKNAGAWYLLWRDSRPELFVNAVLKELPPASAIPFLHAVSERMMKKDWEALRQEIAGRPGLAVTTSDGQKVEPDQAAQEPEDGPDQAEDGPDPASDKADKEVEESLIVPGGIVVDKAAMQAAFAKLRGLMK